MTNPKTKISNETRHNLTIVKPRLSFRWWFFFPEKPTIFPEIFEFDGIKYRTTGKGLANYQY